MPEHASALRRLCPERTARTSRCALQRGRDGERERTRKDERRALLRLEEVLGLVQDLFEKRREPGVPVVLSRHRHRTQNILMNVHRSCSACETRAL